MSDHTSQIYTLSSGSTSQEIVEVIPKENQTRILTGDLKRKIFEIGSKTHFTDTCAFYFECDCCSGNLVLNSDQTFYEIDHCMADESLLHGQYSFEDDTLTLDFDGICVRREYNWENEADTSAVDFLITDTVLESFTQLYYTTQCENRIQLAKIGGDGIGIETSMKYSQFQEDLQNQQLLGRLKKMKGKTETN